ncbi:hypothetical protein ACH5RR_039299 [Cinchona calisaya]|uniref:Uncharacterized protein n=1 Tax=Cinchona calisaya TaxID=153742 RepID=A0ABD2XZM6_9GENT
MDHDAGDLFIAEVKPQMDQTLKEDGILLGQVLESKPKVSSITKAARGLTPEVGHREEKSKHPSLRLSIHSAITLKEV